MSLLLAALVQVVDCAGVPRLELNGKVVSGTAVMPSPRVKPGESRAALTDFATNGVWFSSDIWTMRPPQPNLKAVLCGHVHVSCRYALSDRVTQYVVGTARDGLAYEITFT